LHGRVVGVVNTPANGSTRPSASRTSTPGPSPSSATTRASSIVTPRAAIAVRENGKGEPRYGVLEISTPTEIDRDSNTVLMSKPVYTPRFAQAEPLEAGRLAAIVREVLPDGQPLVVSLDRLLPYLEQQKLEQRAVQVSLDPPLIFHSTRPATLLGFYGAPEFRPVGDSGLQAAVNTPATVLLDAAADGPAYYLLLGESWLTTRSLRDGPWTQPAAMPAPRLGIRSAEDAKDRSTASAARAGSRRSCASASPSSACPVAAASPASPARTPASATRSTSAATTASPARSFKSVTPTRVSSARVACARRRARPRPTSRRIWAASSGPSISTTSTRPASWVSPR